jgi:hypothetical protein
LKRRLNRSCWQSTESLRRLLGDYMLGNYV